MAETPATSVHDEAQRFYALLQTAHEASVTEAGELLPIARRRVDECRAIVVELRGLTTAAEGELERWEQTAASLARSIDPESPEATDGLRGNAIAVKAAEVFAPHQHGAPIHYLDLYGLIQEAGFRIPTQDPRASLLNAISRSSLWESIGGRTGLWKLA
jgi:hypothetical protein